MNEKKPSSTIEIKLSFVIILLVTLVLLVALTITLFVVMNRDNSDHLGHGGTGAPPSAGKAQTTTAASSDIPAGNLNSSPLYPTVETRDSYIPTTSDSVVDISSAITAKSAMLVKVTSDGLVSTHEKAADEKIYPASITKVMTLIVACEQVTNLSVKLTATDEHQSYKVKYEGSGVLRPGDTNTVEDLLYLINYQSDTIACLLIAEHIAGSEEAFVALMNQKAAELGMSNTSFVNCTGLWIDGTTNSSTCRDIATMVAYALDNKMVYSCITSYEGHQFMVEGKMRTYYTSWYSGNPDGGDSLGFDNKVGLSSVKVIGGKTGYIDQSGYTFVTVAQSKTDSSVKYINVMIGHPKGNGYGDTAFMSDYKKIYNTYAK